MLSRKEKRAAASRFIPMNRPPVSVVPLREEPGIKAKACAIPTITASSQPTSEISFRCEATFSATASSTARAIRLTAMTYRFFVNTPSICCLNSSPMTTTGIVPMMINQPSRECNDCSR